MVGVSTGELETMRTEFDYKGTVYVSDICLRSADVNSTSTEVGQVRRFLDLSLPYTLPLILCTNYGTPIYMPTVINYLSVKVSLGY